VVSRGSDSSPPRAIAAYDEHMNLRWRTQLASSEEVTAVGVDRQRNTLVLLDAQARYGSGRLGGIWIDPSGNAGAEFDAGAGPAIALVPRVESGLFLQGSNGSQSAWIAQYEPMSAPSEVPGWLAARPGTSLHMARNGRAYAVISPGSSDGGSCGATIEVVSRSGMSCGMATFPGDQQGGSCAATLAVGYDGTVVEMGGATFVGDGTSNFYKHFRWWTGFFH
jgi:hypothetical protein